MIRINRGISGNIRKFYQLKNHRNLGGVFRELSNVTSSNGGEETNPRPVSLSTQGPWKYIDSISPNHSLKLDAALASYLPSIQFPSSSEGTVPMGSHLIFFNPDTPEDKLSADGYENFQSPGPRFPNRMWYGGSIEFSQSSSFLLGNPSTCIESLHNIEHKILGDAAERVSVTLDRRIFNSTTDNSISPNSENWVIRELRTLIYFSEQAGQDREKIFTRFIKPPELSLEFSHTFTPSAVLLFRYSALTFNSHRIHFDPIYSKEVEGLPGVIVHGPLTVTLLLRWLSSSVLAGSGKSIKSFTYRSLLPLFVDNELTLCASRINEDKNSLDVWIQDHRGSLSVKGTVTLV